MIKDFVFQNTGILLDESAMDKLNEYCSLLVEWNQKVNLTAITQYEDVFIKHFADSMLGSFAVPVKAKVCDIGTGGGFPGIPLKILRNDIELCLVDSIAKKIRFLQHAVSALNIQAEIICCRAEDIEKNSFDVAVSRAVASIPTLLEYMAPILHIGGKAVLYKTDNEDLSASQRAQKILGIEYLHSKSFELPGGHQRVIHVFEKKRETPPIYPRKANKPKTAPL